MPEALLDNMQTSTTNILAKIGKFSCSEPSHSGLTLKCLIHTENCNGSLTFENHYIDFSVN